MARGAKKLPESERRDKKFQMSTNAAEHHLACKVARRLRYGTGARPNLATAMREEFLKLATDDELDETMYELGLS